MHSTLQNKLIYLGGIVLLFIPIIYLGLPASPAPPGGDQSQASKGGLLAQKREDYHLGETSLGNVDPASATMNLVLLGLRGVATSVLWKQAHEQQEVKNWPALKATTESIILLQPHFLKVWDYHGWNLAYNVSTEWDAVGDRYYWVKEGIKFETRGVERNLRYPDLYYRAGVIVGKKIGNADERKQYRRFFRDQDPDVTKFENKPDPAVKRIPNRAEGESMNLNADNYEVAREWYRMAVLVNDQGNQQHIMAPPLFRANPTHALIEHAQSLLDEGLFDETTRLAWKEAYDEWTGKYGREEFRTLENPDPLVLEVSPEEVAKLRATPAGQKTLFWIGSYQDMCNYRYWRLRCKVEQEPQMLAAHADIYNGKEKYFEASFDEATTLLLSGLEKLQDRLKPHPELFTDDNFKEEVLLAQKFWREIMKIQGDQPPNQYPLKIMADAYADNAPKIQELFDQIGRQRQLDRSVREQSR